MAPLSDAAALALQHANMNAATVFDDQVEANVAHGDSTGHPPRNRDDLGRAGADEQRERRSPLTQEKDAADHRHGCDDAHLLD